MDTYELLQIFPEEIWKVILENVKDLKTLENLHNASTFFRERLSSKRSIFLFPGVFKCLLKMDVRVLKLSDASSEEATDEDKVWTFPWGLRLVCSEWNKYIEEHFKNPSINSNKLPQLFTVRTDALDEDSENLEGLNSALAKFGQIMETVQIDLSNEERQNILGYYLHLKKALDYLPNIKNLTIQWDTVEVGGSLNKHLAEMIPLPQLKDLESLWVFERLPSQFLAEFLRQNNGIKKLKLFLQYVRGTTFDFSTPLPNLEHLGVTIQLHEDFVKLKQFAKNWKLKTFYGQFLQFAEKNVWLEIFQMIQENWGNTLERLELHLPRPTLSSHSSDSICETILSITLHERFTQMKVLKNVSIFCNCAISLDFLLPCKETLEVLEIYQFGNWRRKNQNNPFYNNAKDRQYVQYLGQEAAMDNSNLWNLFPTLQSYESFEIQLERPANYCSS